MWRGPSWAPQGKKKEGSKAPPFAQSFMHFDVLPLVEPYLIFQALFISIVPNGC